MVQTGFSFIAQSSSWLPNPIGGIIWFGVDDTNSTVYTPFYCSITEVPIEYRVGNGDMLTYSDNAAFWVFNRLAHFKYLFYNRVIGDIQAVQNELESGYQEQVNYADSRGLGLYTRKTRRRPSPTSPTSPTKPDTTPSDAGRNWTTTCW